VFAKSIYDMNGLPTTGSSAEWARLFPDAVHRDSIEVARMRAAGAVVLGKTAADDFAYHGNGTSSLTGQVRNPYDPTGAKTPGGSSAGSAVSVACGIAFAALGTDDGGSNRIPAQFTGIVGMKPTFGLVPRTGVIPTWPYLDTHGPLARHVADAALLLDAIAGPDASDGLALVTPWKRGTLAHLRHDALVNARLGLVEAHVPRAQMTAESLQVFDRAVSDLSSAGAVVESFASPVTRANVRDLFAEAAKARGDVPVNHNSPPATANALLRYFTTHGGDASADVERGLAAFRAFYDVLPKEWPEMAAMMTQPYESDPASVSFARSRATVTAQLAAAMRAENLDAMIYPTMPFPAPRAVDPWGGAVRLPRDRPVVAVAGIARPAAFFDDLEAAGWHLVDRVAFRDHHAFTAADVAGIARRVREHGAAAVLTTEKDAVRLLPLRPLPFAAAFVPLTVTIEPEDVFTRWLLDRLAAAVA